MDVGRGTQDILLYRPGETWENSIQLVLPSPTSLLAERVREASALGEDLFFTGETMGGGPLTKAVRRHTAGGGRAWSTPSAAATFDDDLDEVRAMGITVVGEEEAGSLSARRGVRTVRTGDVDAPALEDSLERWGISFSAPSILRRVSVGSMKGSPPEMTTLEICGLLAITARNLSSFSNCICFDTPGSRAAPTA